jgi:predicted permease
MESPIELWRKVLVLFRRRSLERDLEEEMRFHLDMKERQNRDEGLADPEARYAARRQFGNELALREAARETWSWQWLDALARDVRFGARIFRRSPGFTAVAVATLALGLGANTAIFALLYHVVLQPLPYPEADRLVKVYLTVDSDRRGPRDVGFSYPKFQDLRRSNTTLNSMAVFAQRTFTVTSPGPAERIYAEIASSNYFPMLGIAAALGRTFLPEEDGARGAHPVVILGDAFWRARFAADPSVIGKAVRLDGKTLSVVGVAPPGVRGDSGRADLWIPLSMAESGDLTFRQQHWHQVIALLKPGVAVEQAAEEVKAIMRHLERAQPSGDGVWDANAVPLGTSKVAPELTRAMVVLYAAVGFVLLIACANLANLTTARMVSRRKEMAVRVAIGAGRAALIRQVLVENVLLSLAGGAAGMVLAVGSMRWLALLRPEMGVGMWPRYMREIEPQVMHITAPVLAFGLALSLAAGIVCGLAPALRSTRGDTAEFMKGGASQGGRRRGRMGIRGLLLVGQTGLVMVLLVGASLTIRSLARLTNVPLGVETRNILTVPLELPYPKYALSSGRQFFDRLEEQVRVQPGVEAVTLASSLPAIGRGAVDVDSIDSRPVKEHIGWSAVDSGFFEVFRIPIRAGRAFTERDRHGPPVAILSERAARTLFPAENPIGHRLKANRVECEIVGVAAEISYGDSSKQNVAVVGNMFMAPARPYGHLIVRAGTNPMGLLPAVRKIVAGLDPEIPVQGARTMAENVFLVHSYQRFGALLLTVFAVLALGLAAVGIYGVFSYAVAARTREFGVRLATGACGADILRLVLREAALLSGAGLALGIPAAVAALRLLGSVVNMPVGADALTCAAMAVVLVSTALAASYIPARRAAKLDPLVALRCD